MEPKFMISEVFGTSWKHTKSQIWVLVGLFIGFSILSMIVTLFSMPAQGSIVGRVIVQIVSLLISCIFMLGYVKNIFQALDGEEPQFSAYGQQSRKIITYLIANILFSIAVCIGTVLLIIPGIYLYLRLQFFTAFIVEEDCGIITVTSESAGHGNQKKCEVALDKILIDVNNRETEKNMYDTDLKVGHYSAYEVCPTCGMATSTALIGAVDDTRYFAHPDRYNADILWFTRGYVEYIIPNFIPSGSKIDQISISLELGSEAPGVNDVWPSDISFYLNGVLLGKWTSPGDFGDVKGIFTPDWWPPKWNQYGMLKLLVVNSKGAFIDGLKISDMDIRQLHLDYKSTLRLRFAVDEDSEHVGGLTIFGKSFGNYNQDINVKIAYSPMEDGN